ncbi:MAG: S-adenosylmethionine:tRNA ribosyltransferase-isomerase [Elusimicrobia bacterium]|nr:S-adenosylmethionine:tRNA ribosyltransferase-isomerase [Elusimicrobiota bacterium]
MPSPPSFRLQDYDYPFPARLVASSPVQPRDSSRLLVLDRRSASLQHGLFKDIGRWLEPGDCLALNRTKVLPARLLGRKPTGGRVELLLLKEVSAGSWTALATRVKAGQKVLLEAGAEAAVESVAQDGECLLRFSTADVLGLMRKHGTAPLPPYILKKRRNGAARWEAPSSEGRCSPLPERAAPSDLESYQTVYAKEDGSIAAPTAGLHFTQGLLQGLREKGVRIVELTLHVGRGTFKPIESEDIREHAMLPESFSVEAAALEGLHEARRRGRRVVAVGTTVVRALEARVRGCEGSTELFIRPGREFLAIDALVTNFHLPKSTPLLLACAFAGRERLLSAYREAVAREYRLFSYGDAMLIL